MKPTILTILLLVCGLAFGQKLHDVSAKGSPVSLMVKDDDAGMGRPYAAARNNSSKGILAMVAVVSATDEHGNVMPCHSYMDNAFKNGVLAPKEERFSCVLTDLDAEGAKAKVRSVEGAVRFVQFDDGTTWGDPDAGKALLAQRPQKLAFLQKLVETYYESGEDAFDAVLNEGLHKHPEGTVAACLKADAEYEKIAPIELAKKRMAAAQQWRALGIF
ncbi:MAG TPA: hypothetical protein VEV41_24225 [Terriglobales bacterium]|nr:hypothetical protein [Terriglobales bacterium]